jgi:ADP-ribose pyrophosphatase YjhB (NUDIX family)
MLRNKQGLTEQEFLEQYDPAKYERPSVTVDMLIFTIMDNKLKLLMIKRADHPSIGQWALPGGFVNMDENLDTAAARELNEETSLDNIYMEQIYTWGDINRDPRTRIITVAYMALVDSSKLKVKAGDDAAEAKWFDVECALTKKEKTTINKGFIMDAYHRLRLNSNKEELSATIKVSHTFENTTIKTSRSIIEKNQIASDHGKIIEHALEVLKDKIKNTAAIFNLLPEQFTLSQLKSAYESICQEETSEKNISELFSNRLIKVEKEENYQYNQKFMENL